jgi:hypothetical protein
LGLRNIHVVFIAMAIALCLGFGAWCILRFRGEAGVGYLVFGIASFAVAVVLTAYGNWFLKKKIKGSDVS